MSRRCRPTNAHRLLTSGVSYNTGCDPVLPVGRRAELAERPLRVRRSSWCFDLTRTEGPVPSVMDALLGAPVLRAVGTADPWDGGPHLDWVSLGSCRQTAWPCTHYTVRRCSASWRWSRSCWSASSSSWSRSARHRNPDDGGTLAYLLTPSWRRGLSDGADLTSSA
jgi:hypothetical protein